MIRHGSDKASGDPLPLLPFQKTHHAPYLRRLSGHCLFVKNYAGAAAGSEKQGITASAAYYPLWAAFWSL
jgi:hypothetical protein